MSFGSRTRSVLDGSVLGGDNLGSVGVRQSCQSWGATRRCLDVRSELSSVLLFLSLFYFPGMEINCGENTSVKYFTGFWGMIYSQWKFRDNPNTPSGVKYFPETIYCRNKHSLNLKLLNSRSNTSTLLSPC